jgi:hypothetical protein
MNYNNILLVASADDLQTLDLSKFLHESFTGVETTEIVYQNEDRQLKNMVRKASRCELLITVGDWAENPTLKKLIDVARIMNIQIIHETNFKKYVEQYNG